MKGDAPGCEMLMQMQEMHERGEGDVNGDAPGCKIQLAAMCQCFGSKIYQAYKLSIKPDYHQ